MEKSFGRIPTWKMFKESYSADQTGEEESFDDIDAPGADVDAADADMAAADADAAASDVDSEVSSDESVADKIKSKILDLKDTIESSEDEFTKEDFLKLLDEVTDEIDSDDADEDDLENDGDKDADDAGMDADVDADAASDDTADAVSEGKTTKVKASASKLSVPAPAKVLKHKTANVTGKVTPVAKVGKKK